MTKERKARWLARQSQESLDRIRAVDADAYRRRTEAETPAQSQARRERDAAAHIVAASKDKLPVKLKLGVKLYTKTSEVQGKLLNNEKYFTRNVVYQEVFRIKKYVIKKIFPVIKQVYFICFQSVLNISLASTSI
ncbi:hypothetical protein AVEN_100927-1 [Araneus ventricosus]|uniref:Uncharacterized protein n=1 Tax=Araneus ventricosus TaxID=182803 RepID=A0A4Y2AW40_ARAVE|nr:hypothetical protein AVEN_100927-1 [Araneus ventricosus]